MQWTALNARANEMMQASARDYLQQKGKEENDNKKEEKNKENEMEAKREAGRHENHEKKCNSQPDN